VALALPRSLEMIIALLGILKSGAAYLPLDPEYPTERLRYMIADAKPVCLISLQQIAGRLGRSHHHEILLDDATVIETCGEISDKTQQTSNAQGRCFRPTQPTSSIHQAQQEYQKVSWFSMREC